MFTKPAELFITLLISPFLTVRSDTRLMQKPHRAETTELNIDYERIYNLSDRHNRGFEGSEIVYPEMHTKESCEYGLCFNTTGYPTDKIRKILNRSQFANAYFEATEEFPEIDITNRFNADEMSLCETRVQTIYPEKAKNLKKVDKVIVNIEGHKQGIVFETCLDSGKCKFSQTFPNEYTSYCKQKYINKRLMVLEDGSDKFVFDTFEVPSCCVCTVKKVE